MTREDWRFIVITFLFISGFLIIRAHTYPCHQPQISLYNQTLHVDQDLDELPLELRIRLEKDQYTWVEEVTIILTLVNTGTTNITIRCGMAPCLLGYKVYDVHGSLVYQYEGAGLAVLWSRTLTPGEEYTQHKHWRPRQHSYIGRRAPPGRYHIHGYTRLVAQGNLHMITSPILTFDIRGIN